MACYRRSRVKQPLWQVGSKHTLSLDESMLRAGRYRSCLVLVSWQCPASYRFFELLDGHQIVRERLPIRELGGAVAALSIKKVE
jgi:hypothetical protein